MSEFGSFRSIIELWPTRLALAAELGHTDADTAWTVCKWHKRNRIPDAWWSRVVVLPIAVENGVTLELLAGLAAREREAVA